MKAPVAFVARRACWVISCNTRSSGNAVVTTFFSVRRSCSCRTVPGGIAREGFALRRPARSSPQAGFLSCASRASTAFGDVARMTIRNTCSLRTTYRLAPQRQAPDRCPPFPKIRHTGEAHAFYAKLPAWNLLAHSRLHRAGARPKCSEEEETLPQKCPTIV